MTTAEGPSGVGSQEQIRDLLERKARAIHLRPETGQATARTTIRLKPGLECEVEEGAWKLTVAMS